MTGRFTKAVVLLVAAGVMYAGPVAACVCADRATDQHVGSLIDDGSGDHMASMPCCPDEPQETDRSPEPWSDSDAYAACDPMPADVLPASVPDVPAPIAMVVVTWAWPAHGPPETVGSKLGEPHRAPNIYLTTRRLRI